MPRKSAAEQWHHRLENSSVPLVKLSADRKPIEFASCCLGDFRGHRVMLSAAHQVLSERARTSEPGDWAILSRHEPGRNFYWFPTEVNYLLRVDCSNLQVDYVDFSYCVLTREVTAFSQRFDDWTGEITWETPKTMHRLNFDAKPRRSVYYGFAGHTKHTEIDHPTSPILSYEIVVVDDLKYVETRGDLHVFMLGAKHPGHERFRGCSGAPIISKTGQVVALVCHGEVEGDLIYGVALSAYKTAVAWQVKGASGDGCGEGQT